MLTKEAKTILNYLKPLFLTGEDTIDSTSVVEATGLPEIEVKTLLKHLHQEGYFKYSTDILGNGTIHAPQYKAFHFEEFEVSSSPSISQTNIFHGSVSNSAIGNTGTITINNGISYTEARDIINSKSDVSDSDKAEALKVIDYIENVTSVDAPLPKSFLSRFSDIVSKHSWLPTLIGNLLIRYFIG